MTPTPDIDEVMTAIATRKKEMEVINHIIKELLTKVKHLTSRHDELKSLNHLDNILLKELQNGTD
jgi:uncharacterized protein YoxC